MNIQTLVFDDAHPAIDLIRDEALKLDYTPREHEGKTYTGIGTGFDPQLAPLIERAFGRVYLPKLEFFRLGLEKGTETTIWIHADISVRSEYAALLYCSRPTGPMQGTAFWRHKEMGIDRVPDLAEPFKKQWSASHGPKLDSEGNDESKWDQTGLIGFKYNRLVIYPAAYFHSRFPRDTWGNKADEGRLLFCSFFDLGKS